jgi:DNA-directed RNA polymerase specialized sigma24 family protein
VISMNAEVERPQRLASTDEDQVRPRPRSLNGRRYNSPRRPGDEELRVALGALFVEHQARVHRVVVATLRFEDLHMADDFAQEVWLAAWRNLLRGNPVPERPAALLSAMARYKVRAHYKLARVRREVVTDPLERLVDLIGAAA